MDLLAPVRGLTVAGGSVKVVSDANRFPDRGFSLRSRILQESPSLSGVLRQELSVAHKCRLWREGRYPADARLLFGQADDEVTRLKLK